MPIDRRALVSSCASGASATLRTAMDGLRTTHKSTVTEDQIDHLGHMNVAFYALNAQAGTHVLLQDLPAWGGRPAIVDDVYTRHRRRS